MSRRTRAWWARRYRALDVTFAGCAATIARIVVLFAIDLLFNLQLIGTPADRLRLIRRIRGYGTRGPGRRLSARPAVSQSKTLRADVRLERICFPVQTRSWR